MKVRTQRSAVLGAAFASITSLAVSAPGPAARPLADLDRYVEHARAEWKNIGLALAVVQGDTVIYSRGFGSREYGKPAKVDPDTLFQIGSTSKAFTTAALGLLAEEGKLRWDDAVIDHLPGFRLQYSWLTSHLTIRDTVTHRSGLVDSPYYVLAVMDAEAALNELRYVSFEGAFRDSYNYSNLMYGVAGRVVATASGMSWNEFVKRRILQPLGMTRSGTTAYEFWDAGCVTPTFYGSARAGRCSYTDARDPNVAMPHLVDEHGEVMVLNWQTFDNAAAAGTMVSSAADMAKWMILHLNDGRFAGRQLLQPDTVRELHATQNLHVDAHLFPFEETVEGYALGWRKAEYQGHPHLSHGGGIIGFPAYVALLPDRKAGVVVLSNSPKAAGDGYALHKAIAFRVFDSLLGAPPRDWSREFLSRAKRAEEQARSNEEATSRARLPNAPPSLPLQQYTGDYQDPRTPHGRVSVRLENGQLTLSFAGEGAFSGALEPWHHDVFRLRRKFPFESWREFPSFSLDSRGRVVSMSAFETTFQHVPLEEKP